MHGEAIAYTSVFVLVMLDRPITQAELNLLLLKLIRRSNCDLRKRLSALEPAQLESKHLSRYNSYPNTSQS